MSTIIQCKNVLMLLLVASLSGRVLAAGPREQVLGQAAAYWNLGDGGKGAAQPLKQAGKIELGLPAEGEGALPGSKVARLANGYFDAGKELKAEGSQVTVYLRARDPRGQWSYALFSKRGGHEILNFNLFCIDLGGSPGTEIGLELHGDGGFVQVSFPVSRVNPTAWHDLVGRYDGKAVELICDGQIMAKKRWKGGNLTQNSEPVLIGGETDAGKIVRPFTGEMEEAALWTRALADNEVAQVMRKDKILPDPNYVEPYASPIHYRPEIGRLADTIPFFWKGEYHIFYLRGNVGKVPWEHIVSTDLIHWKELPTALVSDGDPNGPDGEHMFTGSVIEKDGTFHIFYTGWNPRNPKGREFVCHATSPDLIKWTKRPEFMFSADGVHYANQQERDFRDPYVFWNEQEQSYWMLLCAREPKKNRPVQGLAKSKGLIRWNQVDPLWLEPAVGDGTPECPDLFSIGEMWYLLHSPSAGTTDMRHAKEIRGPYKAPETPNIDTPILYAAKRMFDGKRHVITGWLRDLDPERDNGGMQWGGTQSVPREVYAGPGGQLYFRPLPEATAVFTNTVLDLAARPQPITSHVQWQYTDAGLVGRPQGTGSQCAFEVPANYMLQCKVQLDPKAVLTLALRQQDEPGSGYHLVLRPAKQEAEIGSDDFRYPRRIALDASRPITIQAFVQGSIIECFINGAYPFSCRAYNHANGRLGLDVVGGTVQVRELTVKTPAAPVATEDPDFRSIFNGKNLDGWKAADMSYWSVEDKAITAKITEAHPCTVNQYLVWQGGELGDFELKLRFRITGSPNTNSGFQFRSKLLPNNDVAGYQMDNNRNTDWLVRLYDEHGRETLAFRGNKAVIGHDGKINLTKLPGADGPAPFKLEEWHEYHLICQGTHLTLKVNDQLMAEVIDDDPKQQDLSGILALQLHSGPPMTVQFKDIRLNRHQK